MDAKLPKNDFQIGDRVDYNGQTYRVVFVNDLDQVMLDNGKLINTIDVHKL